ncbi:YchJ family protein [Actinomyces polynesiensis]|uniref:YchJ family protein n=1 Tax=Actinomyces polynesiensis TaxID=1325934 RepID=UPI000694440B|nr:YchJ family metal-binding protein [Actinomyces polynesiensis]
MSSCPCGSGRDLDGCCGPFLDGSAAPTAEALMRSRYSAFVRGDEDHLFRTWHPRTRPPGPYAAPDITWTGLQVLRTSGGGEGELAGTVEFIASWRRDDGVTGEVHEISRFARRAGRWFYLDGELAEG